MDVLADRHGSAQRVGVPGSQAFVRDFRVVDQRSIGRSPDGLAGDPTAPCSGSLPICDGLQPVTRCDRRRAPDAACAPHRSVRWRLHTMRMPPLVADPQLVTAEWLTAVLRHGAAIDEASRVVALEPTAIGTGQVGANIRYVLAYDGPPGTPTVVCKFSSRDPQSPAAGVQTLTYETEV